ncbi:MAG: HDOD domain-containing protein [Candidatus Acidiferrum sp.]|jgi:putative nucleotidyltransferase with HDIG domain
MNTTVNPELRKRIEKLRALPSSPAVLEPLLELLRQPPDNIEVERIAQLVSYEKTIAAQLLRIANSPLYSRVRPAESIQAAIVTLGIQRIEDILLSNCFGQIVPADKWVVDADVFWRHSFGCALVCREFAERIGYSQPDKAYLAGLLHDIGILVTSLVYTEEYRAVLTAAAHQGRPLYEVELEMMGFTHCDSGAILAVSWQLPPAIAEVIEWHHAIESGPSGNPLIALTHLADLLCRVRSLGYGYEEWRAVDLEMDVGWTELAKHVSKLAGMDLARFTLDLDAAVERITVLVDTIFARP